MKHDRAELVTFTPLKALGIASLSQRDGGACSCAVISAIKFAVRPSTPGAAAAGYFSYRIVLSYAQQPSKRAGFQ